MGLKSEKTFEDIVERLVALVDPPPSHGDSKVDNREEPAADQSDENGALPPSATPFDQKKR